MTSLIEIVVAVVVIVIVGIIAGMAISRRGTRLRALPDESRARYADTWRAIETRFVDSPREAVGQADQLAVEIYRERGARMDDGKVPKALEDARGIARARADGAGDRDEASQTEHLRRAMVAYQHIVDEGVGEATRRASEARRREVAG